MTSKPTQRGNVLFYLLICVVLFAALGYAFTRSTMNPKSITDQRANLLASELLDYSQLIAETASKLKLRGCGESQLNFTNIVYQAGNGSALMGNNTNAPSSKECNMFDPAGGNIPPHIPPSDALDPCTTCTGTAAQPGHFGLRVLQVKNVGKDDVAGTAAANDLVMSMSYLNKDVCRAINRLIGIGDLIGSFNNNGGTIGFYTNGSFTSSFIVWPYTASYEGKPRWCNITGGSAPNYIYAYWTTILPR